MNRQDVDFVVADQSVDDSVRAVHDFPDQDVIEFLNGSAGLGKGNQSIRRRDQASNNDCCVVG